MKKIYVGPKRKTIENSTFFDNSITLFGDDKSNNIFYQDATLDNILAFEYWNPDNNNKEIEIYNKLLKKIKEPCEIMAHDYKIVSQCKIPDNYKLVCKNKDSLIRLFSDKIKTRHLLKDIIPMLNYQYIKGKKFDYNKISINKEQIVVQHPLGSGGSKTFLFTKNNYKELTKKLLKDETYIISKYMKKNTPYNINCIIGKNNYIIFPPSIQDLDINDKIEYIDSFYDIKINKNVKDMIYRYTSKICDKLKNIGYRGIFGIDYIYTEGQLYFIEINPRFQGSSRKLDKILVENNYPSIFEYNYLAFQDKRLIEPKRLKNYLKGEKNNMNEKYKTFKKYFDKNKMKIEELEYLITQKCNLNCVGYCSEGGPGKCSMTIDMIDESMRPFKEINILKILGGEPSLELDIVQRIYDNIVNNKIKVNEVWFFTNGTDREKVEKMIEIFAKPTRYIRAVYVYISRGKYHDRSMKLLKKDPKIADDNYAYFKKKYKGKLFVEKQWDEERPLNVGLARGKNNNPIKLSKDTRNLVLFGDNKVYKLVFSPQGYERPFFCNPEQVPELSFGHLINDGIEAILVNGLRFNEMTDEIVDE